MEYAQFIDLSEEEFNHISVQDIYRPVLKMKIPPVPNKNENDPAYQWWKEQLHRCVNGWVAPDGRYLNGYLYFYLNFCIIPIRIEGTSRFKWETPFYRDNDQIILDQIWLNTYRTLPNGKEIYAKNHIQAKPRGIAWTTFTLLGVALWTFVFRNDAEVGLAYPNNDVMDTEREWFINAWTELHPMFKRWVGKDLEIVINNKDSFGVGYSVGKKNNKVINKVRFNVIGQETNAGVYKGKRLNLMIAAEAGLWAGDSLKNYVSENEPSIKLGDEQWGMCLIGGTSNMIINKSTAYREMFIGHKAFNATALFTPKTMVLRGHIDYRTGISDQESAMAQIMAHRESKIDDAGAYHQELVENPIKWEEAFMVSDGDTAYNGSVINQQLTKIRLEGLDKYWIRGKIEYVKDRYNNNKKEVRFIHDRPDIPEEDKGDWYINLEGQPNKMYKNLHIAGIDDRYKSRNPDKKSKKSDSKNAMVIWRRSTTYPVKSDMPCAIYFGDKHDMTVTYEEFWKGILLYDVEKTLYENNSEGFIMYLRDYKKELHRLYYHNGEWGMKVSTAEVKAELTYLGTQFLAHNREKNITHPWILEAMNDWGHKNTDIGSAFHLVLKLMELTEETFITQVRAEANRSTNQDTIIKLGIPNPAPPTEYGGMKRIKLGPRPN